MAKKDTPDAPPPAADTLSTPVIVEDDGWTLVSGSSDRPSEEKLREALGAAPVAAAAEPTTPDAPPAEPAEPEPPPEPTDDETLSASEDEPAPEPEPAKRRRATHDPQRRIDKMHKDLQTERERGERLEKELAELRAAQRQPAPEPTAPTASPAATLPPKPLWGGAEGFEAQGKTWEEYEAAKEEYTAAFLRHELATALAEERTRTQTASVSMQADAAFAARVEAIRAKRPDYDQVVENLGDLDSPVLRHLIYYSPDGPSIGLHLAEHLDQAETLAAMNFSRPIIDTVRRSQIPVKLLEHFATHPEVVDHLLRMDPVTAISTIGRLEERLDVGPTVTTAAARPVTSARPPLRTVSGGAPPSRTPTPAPPSTELPFSPEYINRANQEEAMARRRQRGY